MVIGRVKGKGNGIVSDHVHVVRRSNESRKHGLMSNVKATCV